MDSRLHPMSSPPESVITMEPMKPQPQESLTSNPTPSPSPPARNLWIKLLLGAILALCMYSAVIGSLSFFRASPPTCTSATSPVPVEVPTQPETTATSDPLPAEVDALMSPGGNSWTELSMAQLDAFPSWKQGRLYNGTVKVYLIWYGQWSGAQQGVIRGFIQSLEEDVDPTKYGYPTGTPSVHQWWSQVNAVLKAATKQSAQGEASVTLSLGGEFNASSSDVEGLIPSQDIPRLLTSALTSPRGLLRDSNAVYMVAVGTGVVLPSVCTGGAVGGQRGGETWYGSGNIVDDAGNTTFLYVANPNEGEDCNGVQGRSKALSLGLKAGTGDHGLDAMVDKLGGLLASTITNIDGMGYVTETQCAGSKSDTGLCDMYTICQDLYGEVQPSVPSGGRAFNAVGKGGAPFVLNKLWSVQKEGAATPHCAMSLTDMNLLEGEYSSLQVDYGRVAFEILPISKLDKVMDYLDAMAPRKQNESSVSVPEAVKGVADIDPPFSDAVQSLLVTGLLQSMVSTGEAFTVFLPDEGFGKNDREGESSLGLGHTVKGRFDAAALQKPAGAPLTSLYQNIELATSVTSANGVTSLSVSTLLNPGAPARITKPNLLCTDKICFHGIDGFINMAAGPGTIPGVDVPSQDFSVMEP